MVTWIKTHKLVVVLLLIIAYLLTNVFISSMGLGSTTSLSIPTLKEYGRGGVLDSRIGAPAGRPFAPDIYPEPYQPVSDSQNRVVIKESNMSLLVKDVRGIGDQIVDYIKSVGGFMVTTSYSSPDESPYAEITVRVPTGKLDESLAYFRSLAVKVSSENLLGTDVTEQYEDLDARLATLRATKTKFEEILNRAITVQEILEVQRELINLAQQTDIIVGQKMALTDNARLTRVTIYLSTDELALPYVPDTAFRPNLIFKQAVRSLVNTLRSGGVALIWIGVFSVIWIPILILYVGFMRWKKQRVRRTTSAQPPPPEGN